MPLGFRETRFKLFNKCRVLVLSFLLPHLTHQAAFLSVCPIKAPRQISRLHFLPRAPAAPSSFFSSVSTQRQTSFHQRRHFSSSVVMFGEVTKVEDVHTLKWLKLCRIFFKDQTGKERQWEGVQRTTAKKTESNPDSLDAVAIVAFLTHSKEKKPPEMVFVRQFRPPVGTDTIELPAGLIDEGETPEQAAIRELREETGFIGEVVGKSPNLCLCPGITGETIKIITVNVDMDKEENKSPKQQLDEEEQIQVIRIPCDSMLEKLEELSREGCRLFDGVYCFAFALTPTVQSFFKEGSA